jgi:hypothetical protein
MKMTQTLWLKVEKVAGQGKQKLATQTRGVAKLP